MYVYIYVCMYQLVKRICCVAGSTLLALASFPGLPRWEGGLVHTVRTCAEFSGNSNTESTRECHGISENSAHARTVCTRPSSLPRGRPGNEAMLAHTPQNACYQCTMYGAVRQSFFELIICFSILLKVLCTGTHTVGSPASTHNSSIRDG